MANRPLPIVCNFVSTFTDSGVCGETIVGSPNLAGITVKSNVWRVAGSTSSASPASNGASASRSVVAVADTLQPFASIWS